MRPITDYKSETLQVLRNCRYSEIIEAFGIRFVRCLPVRRNEIGRELTDEEKLSLVHRVVVDCNEPGVRIANNPDFGGDYVRVDVTSVAYQHIGYMKS